MSALEDIIENEIKEAYNEGLDDGRNEVWEWIKKLCNMPSEGRIKMFGGNYSAITIVGNHTPQEVLAKLDAYEKEQAEIKIGDVVKVDGTNKDCGIVIAINEIEKKARLMYVDTSFRVNEWYLADLKKTGKNIDIQKILEQIKGDMQ